MTKHRGDAATASPAVMRVNPALAAELGLNESIVLLQLEYLTSISSAEERDGQRWTYQKWTGGFDRMFPWMVERTLRRCIASLVEKGLVETSRHRTNWYTVNVDRLAELTGQIVTLKEGEIGQNVTSQDDNLSSPGPEIGQNVRSQHDKMSSDNMTNCHVPIHIEITTKTTTKTLGDAADAAPEPEAKPVKKSKQDALAAKREQNAAVSRLRALFNERFARLDPDNDAWLGTNFRSCLSMYSEVEIAGTLKAISARNPSAKENGFTLITRDLGEWVAEYLASGQPDVFPSPISMRPPRGPFKNGATNGPTRLQEAGGIAPIGNKYREAAALEEAVRERARSQRTSVPA